MALTDILNPFQLAIDNVVVDNRLRKEMGNIDELTASIKEFGLIQPIVIDFDSQSLVAGGRRLVAVKKLGWTSLQHGRDFVWRNELENEDKKIRLQAVELEENLRRKSLTWQEEIEGKARLLKLMQSIHGEARMGAPTKSERMSGGTPGFGVNKLAAMLGESNANTSNDLALASAIAVVPELKKAANKEEAKRQMVKLVIAAQAKASGIDVQALSFMPQAALVYQIVIKCRDESHQRELLSRFTAEGLECRVLIS